MSIDLIRTLRLEPHPEGGYFREIHRATASVHPDDGRGARSGLTLIYFLLDSGGHSRWHRVTSDEVWHFIDGAPLELFRMDAALTHHERMMLGPLGMPGTEPVRVVAAGEWQAARTTGDWTLVACAVGPGFDFADFAMLADDPPSADAVRRRVPDAAALL